MEHQLEHHEHAKHAAGHGGKHTALLVATLAALLAITEQGAKHAEVSGSENSIAAADAWAQYQGKSVRQTVARDMLTLIETLPQDPSGTSGIARKRAVEQYSSEIRSYEQDPTDGKRAVARRARGFEERRDKDTLRMHCYDNAAAMLELGIVLATVSVIAGSRLLLFAAMGLGAVGGTLAALGLLALKYAVL